MSKKQQRLARPPIASADAELLSAGALGKRYKVSRQTVLNWYHNGIIPSAFHVGDVIRFNVDDTDAALAKYSRGVAVPA